MTPTLVVHHGLTAHGIDATTLNEAERDPTTARIPGLWARFYKDDVLGKLHRKTLPVLPVGVYTDYESDHTGRYRILVGAVVEEGTAVPDVLAQAAVTAGNYLVFSGQGQLPAVVIQTWMSVWQYFDETSVHQRAYTADFEVYRAPDAVDIYIAVK
jgi:predicted transcriptional regulator YdeE